MPIRENPSLMREVIEKMDYMVRVMDEDHKVIYMNQKMREEFGHTLGHICYSILGREDRCEHCVTQETMETGKPGTKNVPIGDKYYNVISSPVNIESGQNYSIELLSDITEQKKTEDELMRHYEKLKADIEFAKNIQNRALPIDGTYWDTMEINSLYYPSEDLGGDLFDVIKMNGNESLSYIADVSGHGITSSLLTIFLRQMVRGRVGERKVDLIELLDILQKSYNELGIDKEQYLTILFFLYNKETKEATFLNAGHNCMPIIVKSTGEVLEAEVKGLPVCNLMKKTTHKAVTVPVETGDRIILYTDGITEASNEEKVQYGTGNVISTIKDNLQLDGKALVRKVIDEVEAFIKKPAADDMAIIIAQLI
ncbi:MAG TPA: PP2C family protein-serine/threonine phosphatase [Anaerovoracaceae bacterium]|nr:PP2C family protein-serine/threonine phosphatase [Anaerovoracaceae bacterium]